VGALSCGNRREATSCESRPAAAELQQRALRVRNTTSPASRSPGLIRRSS
jgi:hypothetical protein